MIPCGCGNISCPYCNPVPANIGRGYFNFAPNIEQGWQCPICKVVHAPSVLRCDKCKPQPTEGK